MYSILTYSSIHVKFGFNPWKTYCFFLTWRSFISTSITSKWAALQWLSCFLIPCTSNVSSHTILSMSWGALTVRVRLNAISVRYYPKYFLLVCWSFFFLKIIEGKGCVFTYDAVGSYERVGYSAQGSGATLITPFLDNQLKSPSPLLLPSKVWFWNFLSWITHLCLHPCLSEWTPIAAGCSYSTFRARSHWLGQNLFCISNWKRYIHSKFVSTQALHLEEPSGIIYFGSIGWFWVIFSLPLMCFTYAL